MKLRLLLCVIQLALVLLCTVVVMGWIMSLVLLRHETDRFIFRVASETPGIVEVFVQEHGLSLADEPPVMALRLHLSAELQTEANQSWAMLSLMALIGVTIAQGVLIVRGDRARGRTKEEESRTDHQSDSAKKTGRDLRLEQGR